MQLLLIMVWSFGPWRGRGSGSTLNPLRGASAGGGGAGGRVLPSGCLPLPPWSEVPSAIKIQIPSIWRTGSLLPSLPPLVTHKLLLELLELRSETWARLSAWRLFLSGPEGLASSPQLSSQVHVKVLSALMGCFPLPPTVWAVKTLSPFSPCLLVSACGHSYVLLLTVLWLGFLELGTANFQWRWPHCVIVLTQLCKLTPEHKPSWGKNEEWG